MSELDKELPPGDIVHLLFGMLSRAQQRFGTARFEIGAVLSTIHEHGLWKGRATSFAAFLEDARIHPSAAYQYMRVAKTFFFGLGLSTEELDEVTTVPMSMLDMAAKVATKENCHDILTMLTSLHERDARTELEAMVAALPPSDGENEPRMNPRVARLCSEFRQLPDDLRIEFIHQLQRPADGKQGNTTKGTS